MDEDRQEDRHRAEIRLCYCLQDVSMLHNSVLLEMFSDIRLYKENDRIQLFWSELNDKTKLIKLVGNKGCSCTWSTIEFRMLILRSGDGILMTLTLAHPVPKC